MLLHELSFSCRVGLCVYTGASDLTVTVLCAGSINMQDQNNKHMNQGLRVGSIDYTIIGFNEYLILGFNGFFNE